MPCHAMPVTYVVEVCVECTISVFPHIVKSDLGKRWPDTSCEVAHRVKEYEDSLSGTLEARVSALQEVAKETNKSVAKLFEKPDRSKNKFCSSPSGPALQPLRKDILLWDQLNRNSAYHQVPCGLSCMSMETTWIDRMENLPVPYRHKYLSDNVKQIEERVIPGGEKHARQWIIFSPLKWRVFKRTRKWDNTIFVSF